MNTLEIYKALSSQKCTKKIFRGVFALDKIPLKIMPRPSLLIINTDKSNKPGQHWIAIHIPSRGYAEYFDSYGRPPMQNEFKTFLKRNTKKYRYNRIQLQSPTSDYCGMYACMFLLYKCCGKSLLNFTNNFASHDLWTNDAKISKCFTQVFLRNKNSTTTRKKNKHVQSCLPCL